MTLVYRSPGHSGGTVGEFGLWPTHGLSRILVAESDLGADQMPDVYDRLKAALSRPLTHILHASRMCCLASRSSVMTS